MTHTNTHTRARFLLFTTTIWCASQIQNTHTIHDNFRHLDASADAHHIATEMRTCVMRPIRIDYNPYTSCQHEKPVIQRSYLSHTPKAQGEPIASPRVKLPPPRVVKLRARVVKLRAGVVKLRARVVKLRVRGVESGMLGSQTACPPCQPHTVCTKALIL